MARDSNKKGEQRMSLLSPLLIHGYVNLGYFSSSSRSMSTRMEVLIKRPVLFQQCKVVALLIVDAGKTSPDHNPAVGLDGQGINPTIGPWVECFIQGSVRMQTSNVIACLPAHFCKPTPHHDFTVNLDGQKQRHVIGGGWVEGFIQGPVRVKTYNGHFGRDDLNLPWEKDIIEK
jgi:hypothetical protein